MSLKKFITDMLNIESNDIENIDSINTCDNSLEIRIKLVNKVKECPYCKGKVKIHGYHNRKLVHSALNNRKCTIIFAQRRYRCDNCELTFSENNPFINTSENLTYETKINVLKELKYPNNTYTSTARRFNLSPTKVQRLFDNHVDIKRKPLPEVLSIDEHHFPNSNYDSEYICILMDFYTGVIIDILPDRKKDYLISYFSNIKNETMDKNNSSINELNNVKFISIDLWEGYRQIAKTYFPKSKVCADSYHILVHLTKCFNDVRLRCRRNTQDPNMEYLLTKFKEVFIHDVNLDNEPKFNKRFNKFLNLRQIRDIAFDRFPELKKAYELKEAYIVFNKTTTINDASENLNKMIKMFAQCGIEEYIEFYNLLINWYEEIVNSFHLYKNKRINNSYIESRNRIIELLLYNANGYVNFKRARNRILYCLNKQDTYKL